MKDLAIIITPTIGNSNLEESLKSVERQSFKDILHLIVIDGEEHELKVKERIKNLGDNGKRKILTLPFNTGKNNFYGHRIYAACSFLIDAKYVLFLDEDNWFDDNHVETLINLIESEKLDWAFSLRKINSEKGDFVTHDNCESLGNWPPYSGMPNLVDTNCYAIRSDVLANVGHKWYGQFAADRVFFKHISTFYPKYNSTFLYTSNYRLQEKNMPNEDYFLKGNEFMLNKYLNRLPWQPNAIEKNV